MIKIFAPHELKNIEVDAQKKIFRINGEDFGTGCTEFSITCRPDVFEIRVEVDTTICFATYDSKGRKREEKEFKSNDSRRNPESNVLKEDTNYVK